MKSKLLFLVLLITSGVMAQKLPREILYGQLVADSISVDNVLITNKTANIAAVSRKDGSFQIRVYVKDTLIFSGLNFPRQILILTETDLKFKELKIRIESRVNNLDEVVINTKALSGDLTKDSKNIKLTAIKPNIDNQVAVAKLYEGDTQTSPDNKLMPGYLDDTYMMDFAAIGRKIIRSFKRSEAEKNRNKDVSRFSVLVQNRFSADFFRNNLKMNKEETSTFLHFCEKDSKAVGLIANGNDFELIEFLELKKQEFRELKKE